MVFYDCIVKEPRVKRDPDLLLQVLREVEEWPTTRVAQLVKVDGHSSDEVGYHAWLLADAGLIEGQDLSQRSDATHHYAPMCLTNKGHDFLNVAREPQRWQQIKSAIVSRGLTMAVDVASKNILNDIWGAI